MAESGITAETPTQEPDAPRAVQACPRCGLIQSCPVVPAGHVARCPRCHARISKRQGHPLWCLSLAGSAMLLYPFAIFLPILHIEKFGHQHSASIWSGCSQLLGHGHWFTGFIVLFCSVILPIAKLLGLLIINSPGFLQQHHRASTYHLIELSGRWGMLDVMLVAILVASVKLGDSVSIDAGLGLTVFCICVIFSLAASACFNPHSIWSATDHSSSRTAT